MNEKILVVDDEKEIADLLEVYLKNDNYIVHKYYNGIEALECIQKTEIDLAILDVMLPDIDGFRICQKIRENFYFPVIMLTAKIDDGDKIMGLTIGADDYITKPFNPLEVIARVKTQLRRYQKYNNPTKKQFFPKSEYDIRGLIINKDTHKCFLFGKEISLTPIEFSILWYLCEHQGKNDLIMYLAHDLKTPLSSVIGYLTLLHDDEQQISQELREKYLSISLDKAERLEDLINEFFEITRFNLSNITLQYSNINLTRLLEQLIYEFKPILKEKNLKCTLNSTSDIMLHCDANKIQRVFDNLLRNAVIYSYTDTEVAITTELQENTIVITFENFGNPIAEEKLKLIFEQFYRVDTSRNTTSGGAGLGLAIAKHIVELHKGTIVAHSKDECIKFIVTLPLS